MIIDGGACHIGVESTIVECTAADEVTILRPGGITPEMLAEVAAKVVLDTHLVSGKGVPKAPGMKYRHYAPEAPVQAFVGSEQAVIEAVQTAYTEAKAAGKTVGFLLSREVATQVGAPHTFIWGHHGDAAALANKLYTGLLFFDKDVRVDYFRASGAGGQHINKTSSAVRMTHMPSGIVVECQDERSQLENRTKALRVLKARLLDQAQQAAAQEVTEARRSQVGTGDRSERIRTYNYPQGRVTDHRINVTLYKLDAVLNGDLDEFIQALAEARRAELMQAEEHE